MPSGSVHNQQQLFVSISITKVFKIDVHHLGVNPRQDQTKGFSAVRRNAGIDVKVAVAGLGPSPMISNSFDTSGIQAWAVAQSDLHQKTAPKHYQMN